MWAGAIAPCAAPVPTLQPPPGAESWLMVGAAFFSGDGGGLRRAAALPPVPYHAPSRHRARTPPFARRARAQFDGVCNLCDGFVNFVADHDSERRVKFGAQQKHADLLTRVGAPVDLSTVVLIQGSTFYTKSTAALRTMSLMEWPWSALAAASATKVATLCCILVR